jgi:hypothetical protein
MADLIDERTCYVDCAEPMGLLLELLVGGCVVVPSASAPDRQAIYGYDGHCIVADSQARAIYTTTGSLSQRIYDECLVPPDRLQQSIRARGPGWCLYACLLAATHLGP